MGLLSIFRRSKAQANHYSFTPLGSTAMWSGVDVVRRTSAGEGVSHGSALSVPAYYACLNNRSEDASKADVTLKRRRSDGGADTITSHPAARVIRSPNQITSEFIFRLVMNHYRLGWGNAYAEIVRDGMGAVTEYWPIHPGRITPRLLDDGKTRVYDYRPDFKTVTVTLDARDVLHLRGIGDAVSGYSVLGMQSETLGISQAAQRHSGALYGEGMTKRLIAIVKEALKPEGREGLRKRIMGDREKNPVGSRKIPILEGDVSIIQAGIDPKDAQFLESRQFQIEEVARWFRMPLSQIQHSTRAKGWASNEQEFIWYMNGALTTDAHIWNQELALKSLDDRERETMFFEFSFMPLLKGDSAAQAAYAQTMTQNGIHTRNEMRLMLGADPSDDPNADRLTVNSATVFLDEMGNQDEPEPEPEPEPEEPPEEPEEDETPEDEPDDEPDAVPDDDAEDDGGAPEASASIDALRPVFADVATRLVQKESNAIARAIKRHGRNPAAWDKWATGFAERFTPEIVGAFHAPHVAASRMASPGVDVSDLTAAMHAVAGEMTTYTGDSLRAMLEGPDPEGRAAALADRAMGLVSATEGTNGNA